MRDPNRLSWPPLRSDVVAVACFAVCAYCVLSSTWPVLAGGALMCGLFAGLSPRMKGRFGLKTAESSVGGEFVSPFEEQLRQAEPQETLRLGPAPRSPRELPPRRESGED